MTVVEAAGPKTSTTDGRRVVAGLRRRIHTYERRYEMTSSEMARKLSAGDARETAEILKWMQAYHALALIVQQTRMNGIPTTTTEPSTKND